MNCPKCGAPLPEGAKFCGSCGARLTPPAEPTQQVTVKKPTVPVAPVPEEVTVVQPDMGAAAKKGPRGKLVLIAVVLLIVILAGVFFVLGRGGSSKNAYILLQDGKYELLTDLSKEDLIEIASAKSDEQTGSLVRFSQDGKYVYYFTKYDSDSYTGTLCRAEYAKLKTDSSKNEKYITTIASNVRLSLYQTKNGILYRNNSYTLYYYDGNEAVQLAKNTDIVSVNEDDPNKVLYTKDNGDGTEDLYYVTLDKPDEQQKLDSRISEMYNYEDLDNIMYVKGNDEDGYNLYHTVVGQDPEKITNNFYYCYNDSTNHKFFYFKDMGKTISLYDFVYDRYKVTEEPSWSDYRTLGSDGWYTYNDDAYNSAWNHYNMRRNLMDESYDLPVRDLYCYENGQETLVAEDVMAWSVESNCFMYWGTDLLSDQVSIDDLEYANDLYGTLKWLDSTFMEDVDVSKITLYSEAANTSVPMNEDAMDTLWEVGSVRLYGMGSQILMNEYSGSQTLQAADIKDGAMSGFSLVTDDADVQRCDNDKLYYTTGAYTQGDNSYADLFCYENGESKRLAQDVLLASSVQVYEDGTACLYTDSSSNGSELTLLDKDGNKTVVADDVTRYTRLDKDTLLYISDGDLYRYDGKEKKRIATDVDNFWTNSSMKTDRYVWLSV